MKKSFLISTVFFFLFICSAPSQVDVKPSFRRNQIGIQLNPFIDQQFFDFSGYMRNVAALRYGYKITKNITTGIEFGSSFPIYTNSSQSLQYYNYFSYRLSLYTRYSFLSERRIQIFAEASPFYSHAKMEWTSTSDHSPLSINKYGYYVAPGLSLYSKSRRISLDLYYKFSNLRLMNSNRSVFSYKINFNF